MPNKKTLISLFIVASALILAGGGCYKTTPKEKAPEPPAPAPMEQSQNTIPQVQPPAEQQPSSGGQNAALRADFVSFQADLKCIDGELTQEVVEETAQKYGFSSQILGMVANEFKNDTAMKSDVDKKAAETCPDKIK